MARDRDMPPVRYEDMKSAPLCDDQLPLVATVGRGEKGDSYRVGIASDSLTRTILEGRYYDNATREWTSDWFSENVNGGQLSYQYVLRPYTDPQTFTITFIYRRPSREEWSWTTPAIPYIWTIDDDGNRTSPDAIVGSGVATLFVKKTTDAGWTEKLVYPDGTTREDYNAPDPEQAWTVNLSFGIGGDIDVPNIDDLAKIIGVTVEDIRNLIAGDEININGVDAKDLVDYIDKQDDNHAKDVLDHVHEDLGFDDGTLAGDGGTDDANGGWNTVKEYVDKGDADLRDLIDDDRAYIKNALADIVNKFYGGGSIGSDGKITWGDSGKAAVGNMNVFATEGLSSYIRTRSGINDNDVRTV